GRAVPTYGGDGPIRPPHTARRIGSRSEGWTAQRAAATGSPRREIGSPSRGRSTGDGAGRSVSGAAGAIRRDDQENAGFVAVAASRSRAGTWPRITSTDDRAWRRTSCATLPR